MRVTYPKAVNIKADLVKGDVSIQDQLDIKGHNKYNLMPMAIMVGKNTAADDVEPVKCRLRGGDEDLIFYLKVNVIYELAVDKVSQTTTTTEDIFLLGDMN